MTIESDPFDEDVLNPWAALTPEQEKAWDSVCTPGAVDIDIEDCAPLALAKALRPVAEILKMRRWPSTQFAATVRGLVLLCPGAFALVEDGQVSPYNAATIGNMRVPIDVSKARIKQIAPGRFDPADLDAVWAGAAAASADHQMEQITVLAKAERIHSERLCNQADWSVDVALSWIAFRDKRRLCMISGVEALKVKWDTPHSPQSLLLGALKSAKLQAVMDGQDLPATYWFGKSKLEPKTRYRREDLLRLWRDNPPAKSKPIPAKDLTRLVADYIKDTRSPSQIGCWKNIRAKHTCATRKAVYDEYARQNNVVPGRPKK